MKFYKDTRRELSGIWMEFCELCYELSNIAHNLWKNN